LCKLLAMPKTGPAGPAWPMDDELREAFASRLRELGWTHDDFAKRVSELRGEAVTRSAISHTLKRGIQSALIPDMMRAVGLDPTRRGRGHLRMAHGTGGASSDGHVSVDVVRDFLSSPDQIELVTKYQKLDVGNRANVLERVRVLLEVQERDRKKSPSRS
jgi:hypothetical protein